MSRALGASVSIAADVLTLTYSRSIAYAGLSSRPLDFFPRLWLGVLPPLRLPTAATATLSRPSREGRQLEVIINFWLDK